MNIKFIPLYNSHDKNICIITILFVILSSYLHTLLICVLLKNEIKLNLIELNRVGVMFNVGINYHRSNCCRSKCRTFVKNV